MKKLAIGVDIGGINTAFGLVDENGDMYGESVVSTKKFPYFDQYPAYIDELCEGIKILLRGVDFEYELVGIGIGAPLANHYEGILDNPSNLWKWRETDDASGSRILHIVDDIKKQFGGVKVVMTNDANAAAIGEMMYGGAKGMSDFVVVTLGTGLGGGIVANGKLVYGHDSFAGELGHIIVEKGGRLCGCGRRGCLETYVSATGIRRTVSMLLAERNDPSELRDIPFNQLDSLMITQAAERNDPIALAAYEYTGRVLGEALADVVTLNSPEAIFLFGGLAKAGRFIFEPTKKYMEDAMLFIFKDKVKLLPSSIDGKNAAILGASALVWQNDEK